MTDPDRTAEALLALHGETVTVRTERLTEDVDGAPLGVEVTDHGDATIVVVPRLLGRPDLPDPTIDVPDFPDFPPPAA